MFTQKLSSLCRILHAQLHVASPRRECEVEYGRKLILESKNLKKLLKRPVRELMASVALHFSFLRFGVFEHPPPHDL